MKIKGILVMVSVLMSLQLAGCNTMEGLGQDIQRGGRSIEAAAG